MAIFSARNNSFTLTASVTRTLIQLLTATNAPIHIVGYSISLDSTAGASVRAQLVRQSTAGTSGTITAGTHGPFNYSNEASLTALTTLSVINATAEPTNTDVLEDDYIPFGGALKVRYELGQEPVVVSAARIAIAVITPAATTPNCAASIYWRE